MLVTVTGKHLEITDAMKKYAKEKGSKLPRFFDGITQVEIVIEGLSHGKTGDTVSVEIVAHAEHRNIFVATETGDDAYKCIDESMHKVERQLRKKKQKQRNNKHIHE